MFFFFFFFFWFSRNKVHLRVEESLEKTNNFNVEFQAQMEQLKNMGNLDECRRECQIMNEDLIEEEFTKVSLTSFFVRKKKKV